MRVRTAGPDPHALEPRSADAPPARRPAPRHDGALLRPPGHHLHHVLGPHRHRRALVRAEGTQPRSDHHHAGGHCCLLLPLLAHHHPGSAEPPVWATAEERDHLVRALPVGVTTAASTRCPALWMTSALSLMTPLSPPPQLCPGLPMFPSPRPAWPLEVPPFLASPGPEFRVRLEQERSHPHTTRGQEPPQPVGQPREGQVSCREGHRPRRRRGPVLLCDPSKRPFLREVEGLHLGDQRPFSKFFSNFLTHLDVKLLKMWK